MNLSNPQECIAAFQKVRGSMIQAMVRLAAVFAAKSWEQTAATWSEFVESDLGISQSNASKLLKVHDQYVLMYNAQPQQLEGVDIEKLYLAVPMLKEEPVAEVIEKAKLLSRSELRDTLQEKEPCDHAELIRICAKCRKRHD